MATHNHPMMMMMMIMMMKSRPNFFLFQGFIQINGEEKTIATSIACQLRFRTCCNMVASTSNVVQWMRLIFFAHQKVKHSHPEKTLI